MKTPRNNRIPVPLLIIQRIFGNESREWMYDDGGNRSELILMEKLAKEVKESLPSVGTISHDIIISDFITKIQKALDIL